MMCFGPKLAPCASSGLFRLRAARLAADRGVLGWGDAVHPAPARALRDRQLGPVRPGPATHTVWTGWKAGEDREGYGARVSYIARTTATVSDIPELDTDRNPILNFSPDLNYTGLFTGYGHRCGISNELCDTVRDREQRALGGSFGGRVRDWTPTSAVRALARTAIF